MKPAIYPQSPARRTFLAAATLPLLTAAGAGAQSRGMVSRPQGGFRFLPGSPVFAGGAVAEPGFAIVHALLSRWTPLEQGYALVERHLEAQGRPLQALCGMQLRLPRQLSPDQFTEFNAPYVEQLRRWGVVEGNRNPVSRTNVSPAAGAPAVASLHAFSYTVPYAGTMKTFTMSGMVERAPDGVVAEGDVTTEGMQRKLAYVLGAVTDRIAELGFGWPDATHVEIYAAHEIPGALAALAARSTGTVAHGLRWHFGRPPVVGLELELEGRAVLREETVSA
jgi:hypothetical protein